MSDPRHQAMNARMGEAKGEALVDVLDSLLDTGVVADGQLVLSVAGVDLVFVGLRALLASIDTASRMTLAAPAQDGGAA